MEEGRNYDCDGILGRDGENQLRNNGSLYIELGLEA